MKGELREYSVRREALALSAVAGVLVGHASVIRLDRRPLIDREGLESVAKERVKEDRLKGAFLVTEGMVYVHAITVMHMRHRYAHVLQLRSCSTAMCMR